MVKGETIVKNATVLRYAFTVNINALVGYARYQAFVSTEDGRVIVKSVMVRVYVSTEGKNTAVQIVAVRVFANTM
jgi:hypothetical protein